MNMTEILFSVTSEVIFSRNDRGVPSKAVFSGHVIVRKVYSMFCFCPSECFWTEVMRAVANTARCVPFARVSSAAPESSRSACVT